MDEGSARASSQTPLSPHSHSKRRALPELADECLLSRTTVQLTTALTCKLHRYRIQTYTRSIEHCSLSLLRPLYSFRQQSETAKPRTRIRYFPPVGSLGQRFWAPPRRKVPGTSVCVAAKARCEVPATCYHMHRRTTAKVRVQPYNEDNCAWHDDVVVLAT